MIGTPMLKAAGLWKRTSQRGADYFAGRLGGVKIVILENRDRKAENDPTHWLWFTEPTPAATNSAQRTDEARPARTRKSAPYSRSRRTAASGTARASMPDDPLGDLWREGAAS